MQTALRIAAAVAFLPLAFACKGEGKKAANLAPPKAPVAAPKPTKAASQPSAAASKPGAQGDAQTPFSGLIKLADGVDAKSVGEKDILFVMARRADNNQLIAVQRIAAPKFPQRYEMGPKNIMMPGVPFSGPFKVSARVDKDGDPMTKGADDLYADFTGTAASGQTGVHLTMKKLAPGQKPAGTKPMGRPAAPASKPAGK